MTSVCTHAFRLLVIREGPNAFAVDWVAITIFLRPSQCQLDVMITSGVEQLHDSSGRHAERAIISQQREFRF